MYWFIKLALQCPKSSIQEGSGGKRVTTLPTTALGRLIGMLLHSAAVDNDEKRENAGRHDTQVPCHVGLTRLQYLVLQ